TRNMTVGRHSAPSTKANGSLFSALTAKKRSGRHSPDRANTAGGVLAAVRTRPVLSAFIVPTAATAAVVASSLAMAPQDAAPGGQVVAEAPAVATAEPTQATDEFLAKAKKQAKEDPEEITIETKVETPSPEPEQPKKSDSAESADKGGSAGGGESTTGGSAPEENDEPSKSGESAGQSGSCPMSYYGGGDGFDGRKTANGETFDTNKLTAAHKSLPFGSKVKITNTANGKSVTVRVNDRGPYHGNRCFDLSKAAMEAVGGVGAGQINGKYEVQCSPGSDRSPIPLRRGPRMIVQAAAERHRGDNGEVGDGDELTHGHLGVLHRQFDLHGLACDPRRFQRLLGDVAGPSPHQVFGSGQGQSQPDHDAAHRPGEFLLRALPVPSEMELRRRGGPQILWLGRSDSGHPVGPGAAPGSLSREIPATGLDDEAEGNERTHPTRRPFLSQTMLTPCRVQDPGDGAQGVRILLGHELERFAAAAVAITPGWLRSEMMLDHFGTTARDRMRDLLD